MLINAQFNINPMGYAFTHSFFYDHDLAQSWLDDFNHNEDGKQVVYFGDNDYVVIFANEKIMNAPYYKISHLRKMKRDYLLNKLYETNHYAYSYDDYSKTELIDELMNVSNKSYYEYHFDQVSWHSLESDFIIRGYGQGDVKVVKLVSDKNNQFEYEIDSSHLENLYFNTPIYASVGVYSGDKVHEEINFQEYLDDFYNVDKDDLIKVVDEHFKDEPYYSALKFYMENNFPQYPNS